LSFAPRIRAVEAAVAARKILLCIERS